MPRVLVTTESIPANLSTVDGNAYPVAPAAGDPTPGVIPPLFSVVLRPGDTSGADNVFTSWAALYAACSNILGGVRVVFDDSIVSPIHITGGHYNVNNWIFDGGGNFNTADGGAVVDIDVQVTLTFTTLHMWSLLEINCLSTVAPICTVAPNTEANLYIREGVFIHTANSAAPFMHVATSGGNSGFGLIYVMDVAVIGDGTNSVFDATGAAPHSMEINAFTGANIAANSCTGGSTTEIAYDSSCTVSATQTAGTVFFLFADASRMTYTPAVLANWSGTAPTSVADALDRLAAKVGPVP